MKFIIISLALNNKNCLVPNYYSNVSLIVSDNNSCVLTIVNSLLLSLTIKLGVRSS